jgi:hypothetical protein
MPLRDGTQNRPFARPVGRDQAITAAVQIGGYRTTAAASDHHVARSTFLNVNEPSDALMFVKGIG